MPMTTAASTRCTVAGQMSVARARPTPLSRRVTVPKWALRIARLISMPAMSNSFTALPIKETPIGLTTNSCYDRYGNSYLVEWGINAFGVQKVTDNGIGGMPIKDSLIAQKPTTKILLGDWIWHPNRPLNLPQSVWHNYKGQIGRASC